ncbi:hypothetical protein ACHHYP_10205 [Achlya hypogyna]|uniref:Uncharacterized protein n=1 Tax=Achlya hypogyna TaxID=1202772 RepID=A0A1V9ZHZ5_ACHHY|nr:hypothetical protein ACHHYP_10205 [Achlya hypogyna]
MASVATPLIDASGAQRLLAQLQQLIDAQREELVHLRARVEAVEGGVSAGRQATAALAVQTAALGDRIGALAADVARPGGRSAETLGQLVGRLAGDAAGVDARLRTTVDVQALHAATDALERRVAGRLAAVETAVKENAGVAETLVAGADATLAQVQALEQRLATKMNSVDLARVETAVAKAARFAARADALDAAVEGALAAIEAQEARRLAAWETQLRRRTENEQAQRDAFAAAAHVLRQELREHRTSAMTSLAAAEARLQQQAEALAAAVRTDGDRAVRVVDAKVCSLADVLQSSCRQLLDQLQTKANRADCQQALARVTATLQTKEDAATATAALSAAITACAERAAATAPKVDIAVRFVEWFYARGDAYEHNLRSVEAQLGHLTSRSAPHP